MPFIHYFVFHIFSLQIIFAEDIEVVQAVSPDDSIDDDPDQVALESKDQEGSQSVHIAHQHVAPPPAILPPQAGMFK